MDVSIDETSTGNVMESCSAVRSRAVIPPIISIVARMSEVPLPPTIILVMA